VQRTITASYEESFRCALEHFYTCIVEGQEPTTSGRDSVAGVRLQIDIVKAASR